MSLYATLTLTKKAICCMAEFLFILFKVLQVVV